MVRMLSVRSAMKSHAPDLERADGQVEAARPALGECGDEFGR
jgi:hypothetical protein